jgi:hypothetical protein
MLTNRHYRGRRRAARGVVDDTASTDDNDRLERALRTLTAARLVALGIPVGMTSRWCDAWEAEAARRGLEASAASWEDGIRWILGRVAGGQGPPDG